MPSPASHDFRARARVEADRYGPDAWIFVRELLQNTRDAGATRVEIRASEDATTARIVCRDDGEGMSYDHARRFLFALYASSKESRRDQVGRFGVGFWSILRFEPARIVIRSRPRGGGPESAWEVELDGSLEQATRRTPTMEPGTEVLLERPRTDGEIVRRVRDAAHQNARFLTCKGDPERPLPVVINGESIGAPFELPAPSSAFRRRGLRGVVGLGSAARVELFSRGLRVRAAATFDDLLSPGGRSTSRSRVHFAELPSRLAPQALLESDRLEVLLSRADARENRALRRLVRLGQRELARLLDRQLDVSRPLPWFRRWPMTLRLGLRNSLALRTALGALAGAALALVVSIALWGERLTERFLGGPGGGAGPGSAGPGVVIHQVSPPADGTFSDIARVYRGPQVDTLEGSGGALGLRYAPPEGLYFFASLIIDRFDDDGVPQSSPPRGALTPYRSSACLEGQECVQVTLPIRQAEAGTLPIPVPTGHRLDADTLRLDGAPRPAFASLHDAPFLVFDRPAEGTLTYTTTPAAPAGRASAAPVRSGLPAELARLARALQREPPKVRVQRLVDEIRARVAYSVDREVAEAHQAARARGQGLFERTLAIGKGDCDVQNALLVALLQEAGVQARLAIGHVGAEGRSRPWYHAWVEYRIGDGPWMIADASGGAADEGGPAVADDGPGPSVAASEASGGAGEPGVRSGASSTGPTPVAVADGASATPPSASPRVATASRGLGPYATASASLGLLAALALLILTLARRTRRSLALEPSQDLTSLLQGVLQHPESFQSLPAVFQRPLIPIARRPPISIEDARALASAGRLFRSRGRSALAEDAIDGGATVLEEHVPEARMVADALGAADLDAWDDLLAGAEVTPLLTAVNQHLAELGEPWLMMAAPGIGKSARTLDLGLLRLRKTPLRGRRVVVVDADDPWLVEAAAARAQAPAAALFAALDRLLDHLDLPADRRGRILAASARLAVAEAAE
ncbi:MAG: ATP-binding protein [Nannocystaceae bacterium]